MPRGGARFGNPNGKRGGRRPGAGRKPNIANKTTQEFTEKLLKENPDFMPLNYLIAILRDPTAAQKRKDWAAQQAAPYMHPKLSTTVLKGDKKRPVRLVIEGLAEEAKGSE